MTDAPSTTLTLYFIADNPSIDQNRDLFTWATSVDEAIGDWRANYETGDCPEGVFAIPTADPARGPVPWNIIRTEALS